MGVIIDPAKQYTDVLEKKHEDLANQYLNDMVKESGIDEQANAKTVQQIGEWTGKLNKANKAKGGYIALIVILSIITAIGCIVFAVFIANYVKADQGDVDEWFEDQNWIDIIIGVICLCIAIALIVIMCTVIRAKIKLFQGKSDEASAQLTKLHAEAQKQMAPFLALYDWKAPLELWNKVIDIAQLDAYYDFKKYAFVKNKYKVKDLPVTDSATFVQSGSIVGNPFFVYQKRHQQWKNVVYTGTLTISWVEYYTDSEGNQHSRTRTQTLVAHSTHPAPDYLSQLKIIYTNDTASELTFSRSATGAQYDLENKHDQHKLDKANKKLEKLSNKQIKNNGINIIHGDYFEAMFNCTNRNDETQWRVLWTPTARRAEMNVMTSPDGYGDDFNFIKAGPVNEIDPGHLKQGDVMLGLRYYDDESLAEAKNKFIAFNKNYFRSLFFGMAPLLSIPEYQTVKPREYIYKGIINSNAAPLQYESVANNYDQSLFKHPQAITENILKTEVVSHAEGADVINVTAHSFRGEPREDIVPVRGGDGYMHDVVVPWTEYLPVAKTTPMVVKTTENSSSRQITDKLRDNQAWRDFFRNIKGNSSSAKFNRNLISFVGLGAAADAKSINSTLSDIFDGKETK